MRGYGLEKLVISFENVCKTFEIGSECIDAIAEFSLEFEAGEFVGIFGGTGSGKTTLLRLAAGLETPDKGFVSYKSQRLSEMTGAEIERYRRTEVGCIWGARHIYPGLSVIENVAMPLLLGGADHKEAERMAREALLLTDSERYVTTKTCDLSESESRRVSIAQAVVAQPSLLLVDEVAYGLNFFEQDSLLAVMRQLVDNNKTAILAVATDADALVRADTILYLECGTLITQKSTQAGELIEMAERRSKRGSSGA